MFAGRAVSEWEPAGLHRFSVVGQGFGQVQQPWMDSVSPVVLDSLLFHDNVWHGWSSGPIDTGDAVGIFLHKH